MKYDLTVNGEYLGEVECEDIPMSCLEAVYVTDYYLSSLIKAMDNNTDTKIPKNQVIGTSPGFTWKKSGVIDQNTPWLLNDLVKTPNDAEVPEEK